MAKKSQRRAQARPIEDPVTRRFLDEAATANLLNMSRRTLQRWRISGEGPGFVRCGARRVLYDRTVIEQWATAHTFASHAAELAQSIPAK